MITDRTVGRDSAEFEFWTMRLAGASSRTPCETEALHSGMTMRNSWHRGFTRGAVPQELTLESLRTE